MLGLPVLCVLLALTLDESEVYRLPRKAHLLWVPTGLLLAGVLTNDLHQNFFVFSRTAPWEDVYTYNWGYPLTMGWITVCIVSAVGIIASKCRVPRVRRKMGLCLLPMLLMGVYAGLYVLGVPMLRVLFGDMTVVNCLLTAATLECGIRCGLLQSNTGYEELLLASSLAVQIINERLYPPRFPQTFRRICAGPRSRRLRQFRQRRALYGNGSSDRERCQQLPQEQRLE